MAIDLKDQTFGVEIEFTGITRERAAQVVAEHFDTYSSDPDYSCYYTRKISDDTGREWKVMRDAKSLTRLSNIMYQKEDILYHALKVPASRAMQWCRKSDEDYIRRLNAAKPKTKEALADIWYRNTDGYERRNAHYNRSRYRALNLHAYFTKGTVEFRCFNSTTNAGKVRTYVRFAQAVTAQALNQRSAAVHKTQSSNECYTFRTWLIRIGLNGDEFKVPRKYLLENLEGAKDWKDKAAAMERRRIREQQADRKSVV